MANQQLTQYIETEKKRGVPESSIQQALLDAGWEKSAVSEAFSELSGKSPMAHSETVSEPAQKPAHTGVVDMFEETHAMDTMTPSAQATTFQNPQIQNPSMGMGATTGAGAPATGKEQPFFAGEPKVEVRHGMTSRSKIIGAGIAAAILIALIGVGVYAYMAIYRSPQRAYTYAMSNLVNLKSASYNLIIAPQFRTPITNPVTNRSVSDAGIQMTGVLQGLATATPASSAVTTIKLNGQGGSDTYQTEVRMVNNVTYMQFGTLTGLDESTQSSLAGQWFSMTPQSLAAVDTSELGVDGRIIKQLSQTEITDIKNALQSSGVLKTNGRTGSENIQGIDTIKYGLTVPVDGIDRFIDAIQPILSSRGMTEKQTETFTAMLQQGGDIEGSAWISKKDYQLYQIQFALNTPQSQLTTAVVFSLTLWDHNRELTVELPSPVKPLDTILLELQRNNALLNFGASQETSEPTIEESEEPSETDENTSEGDLVPENTNASTTQETNGNTNTSSLDGGAVTVPTNTAQTAPTTNANTSSAVNNAATDTDNDGLTDAEEEEYGSDPEVADTDGDGFTDGEEVENGYDPVGGGKL